MYVILDIEWVITTPPKQTQLSALRINDDCEVMDYFDSFITQNNKYENHIAFGGIEWEAFENGESEQECYTRLSSWLNNDDKIFIWNSRSRDFLFDQWLFYSGRFFPYEIRTLKKKIKSICEHFPDKGSSFESTVAFIEDEFMNGHSTKRLVEKIRTVFISLGFPMSEYLQIHANYDMRDRKALLKERCVQNVLKLEKLGGDFAFTANSLIFHRKDCYALKYATKIRGFSAYEQAIKTHRPCKLCTPGPAKKLEKQFPMNPNYKSVWLVDFGRSYVLTKDIIGRCRYSKHPGALIEKAFLAHDCLTKNCIYFSKSDKSEYWKRIERSKYDKDLKKKMKKESKEKETEKANHLENLKYEFQSIADAIGYAFEIIRVEELFRNSYRVFYVSNNTFADGNRFPDIVAEIKTNNPEYRIQLRHIKDIDGHFVTINEYYSRHIK